MHDVKLVTHTFSFPFIVEISATSPLCLHCSVVKFRYVMHKQPLNPPRYPKTLGKQKNAT